MDKAMLSTTSESVESTISVAPANRWPDQAALLGWVNEFQSYFPKKAHLARHAATRMTHASSFEQLIKSLPNDDSYVDELRNADWLYARRRLIRFKEDRRVLIHECRILPDAANHFLTFRPVGEKESVLEPISVSPYVEELCFYPDDVLPSENLEAVLDQQEQQAKGMVIDRPECVQRFTTFHHPLVAVGLFKFLSWEFRSDIVGDDGIEPIVPLARLGWVNDIELGEVEVFSLNFTVYPLRERDEAFVFIAKALYKTRNLHDKPVMILNKKPFQLKGPEHTYTSYGWVISGQHVYPLFVPAWGTPFSEVLVQLATFRFNTSEPIADNQSIACRRLWDLLCTHDTDKIPANPHFYRMPDNWCVF
jgi:hypothetical protein